MFATLACTTTIQNFKRLYIAPLFVNKNIKAKKKKKCLVSANSTDPTFWGPTPNFFGTSETFSFIFRLKLFFNNLYTFPT